MTAAGEAEALLHALQAIIDARERRQWAKLDILVFEAKATIAFINKLRGRRHKNSRAYLGGLVRAEKLTPRDRIEITTANARWHPRVQKGDEIA